MNFKGVCFKSTAKIQVVMLTTVVFHPVLLLFHKLMRIGSLLLIAFVQIKICFILAKAVFKEIMLVLVLKIIGQSFFL